MKIGKYLEGKIVSVTMPNDDIEKGKKEIEELIEKNNINVIAIGNGTASRESEKDSTITSTKVRETIKRVMVLLGQTIVL